ncbi:Pre-mRNA-splicing factor cef1 [Endocarpon pusillum Z07020]|uniref:Pre-mRNA-splicing factor cef1 n=1 Tax=Endocarpon pusillum (strain Z07020 / HMAS-L-300199) TaxID=1263415 RepID=U1GPQ3_ENDPU|nr:Pre-mRNA-splicing factor cef1 [Endocarpon pusillum Z07020]ERF74298.1 Pre-mRNA-splicing factor cef1 [Endocarpon pusillum Z07020]
MPVVKGGVWTNIEDEILKASVSKYGLNQWARVSSLLARKTPKQCKARWSEWLDPGIRKIEWSKEEDEKLLHLAKLMPTQWRTIAPIVGRTATQCLERYQKLLDEAEAKENDELGLGGPEGAETLAPSGDDVRRLRPGELDPDPESKPARPDTIDLDEDEKEMLSEARARLANTQGKKAKRKARERQLEESRRLAVLQKRRELKNAGINIKIVNRKKGQMDYNADIPFEKPAIPGFYDTQEEQLRNEHQREAFDPRKQQLANKRKGDQDEDPDRKRQKQDKNKPSAAFAAAAKAGQMQKIREAEQQSKRRSLVLPAPQVSEGELEEIVKMGLAGDRAAKMAGDENDGTKGLISNYNNMVGSTPIRTPRAPAQEDHIANEIRNIRALTETQSSLLGGENTPLHEGSASTGFDGIAPRRQQMVTPNPMATPMRGGPNGVAATPLRPGATPLRTPRDNFAINENGSGPLVGQTPMEIRQQEDLARQSLRAKLSSLPRPKEQEWELEELPSETAETNGDPQATEEDAAELDRRREEARNLAAAADFKRQTQTYQRSLPRPRHIDYEAMKREAEALSDPIESMIAHEAALLIANDALKHPLPGTKLTGQPGQLDALEDNLLATARAELSTELSSSDLEKYTEAFISTLESQSASTTLPLSFTPETTPSEYSAAFSAVLNDQILPLATSGNKLEKKLALHLGGYQEAAEAVQKARVALHGYQTLQVSEEAALGRRLDGLREEVSLVAKREREVQERYRDAREELRELKARSDGQAKVNGIAH